MVPIVQAKRRVVIAEDYTILREVLLVADHNAWHTSELVTLRRVLDLKPVKEY